MKSYWNVECYRLIPVEKFSRRGQRFFGQGLKVFEKLEFIHKKKQFSSECYYGYVDCNFHNLTDSSSLKAQKSFAQGPYWYNDISYSKKISHRLNRLDTKHAVFTTSRINFRQKAKTCAQVPKMITKNFFSRKKFLSVKMFFWIHIVEFSNSTEKFQTKGKNIIRSISEKAIAIINFYKQRIFRSIVLTDT